ncbi:MAG: SbcC/MukB-like Walker B domain-containing protein [Planctomycetota bacterium]
MLEQARSAAVKAEQTERARSIAARLRKIDEFERLGEAITAAAKRRVGAQAQRADALAEVESAEAALEQASQALKEQQIQGAEAALEQASQALKEQQIQALARDLPPDTPCPVCGSHTHPGIDPHSPAGGTQDAAGPSGGLAAAHRQVKVLRQALIRSERELVQTEAEHASAKERQRLVQASWLADDPEEAARLQAEGVGARTEALKRDLGRARQLGGRPDGPRARTREQTEAAHREAARHAAAAQASLEAAQAELVRAQRRLKESARRSAVALEAAGFQHPAALEAARRSEAAVALLTAEVRRHEEAFSLARARRAQAQERTRDLTRPNLAALDRTGKDLAEQVLLKVRQEARAEEQQRALARAAESLKATTADLATAEVRQARLSRLAAVAGGRNGAGITFQRYVLASLLDRVLVVASQRLATMTRGRYRLERRDQDRADLRAAGGLDLYVSDGFTGVSRPAATLSGGEGFLAALALALGLADVVQSDAGGVRLGTLFVDEGFGSLDPEALEAALSVLRELEHRGRRVGVISHVAELERRIPTRLEVTASPTGSKAVVRTARRQTASKA